MGRPSVKGLTIPAEELNTRRDFGRIYADQKVATYGNKVSDILSFLPSDLAQRYDTYVKRQAVGDPNTPTASGSTVKEQSLQTNPAISGRDSYENYLAEIRTLEDQVRIKASETGITKEELNKQLNELRKFERTRTLREATVAMPTMDTDTKRQFIIAVSRNSFYLVQLQAAMDELMKVYGHRLQFGDKYYSANSGEVSFTPIYRAVKKSVNGIVEQGTPLITDVRSIEESLSASAIILYQLVQIGAINPSDELKVRPIDLRTGQFTVTEEERNYNKVARRLKVPQKGAFVVNDRINNVDRRYYTFTGVDITATYAIGYKVGNMGGLLNLTWSIHRGKPDAPRGDEVAAVNRARGRRTIAGTMVFAMFDEHPITAMYPRELFNPQDADFQVDSPIRSAFTKPDQIPAFDLIIILTNEYGYASIMTLFGVEIMDDGGSVNIQDLVNEEVVSYTAKDIDLLHSVKRNPRTGLIDPYELGSLQTEALYTRRSQINYGAEGASYYDSYDSYYTSTTPIGSLGFER